MYTVLATNIETLKEKGLHAKDSEVSVAVIDTELASHESPKLYAFRQGMIYDPIDFRPNIAGNHKLPEKLIEEYFKLLERARIELERKQAENKPTNKDSGEKSNKDQEIVKELEKQLKEQKNLLKEQAEKLKTLGTSQQIVHEVFYDIITILSKKQAVYLHGPAGTGKSQLAEQVAEAMELDFYPASTVTQEFKLTGFIDGHGKYHATNFYKAFKNGGIFFLDEMDSCTPEVLVSINGALANGYFDFPHETVKKHKHFRVISAGNTIGRGGDLLYTGRFALDISTLDRFMALEVNYSSAIDNAVAQGNKELIEFAQSIRKASQESKISILMSYRSITRIIEFEQDFDLTRLLSMALTKGMKKEDISMLSRNMTIGTNNKYFKALQAIQ